MNVLLYLILDDEGTNSMHGIDKRKIFPANPRCAPLDAASQRERSGNPGTHAAHNQDGIAASIAVRSVLERKTRARVEFAQPGVHRVRD
jgi:hypothetical protein